MCFLSWVHFVQEKGKIDVYLIKQKFYDVKMRKPLLRVKKKCMKMITGQQMLHYKKIFLQECVLQENTK